MPRRPILDFGAMLGHVDDDPLVLIEQARFFLEKSAEEPDPYSYWRRHAADAVYKAMAYFADVVAGKLGFGQPGGRGTRLEALHRLEALIGDRYGIYSTRYAYLHRDSHGAAAMANDRDALACVEQDLVTTEALIRKGLQDLERAVRRQHGRRR